MAERTVKGILAFNYQSGNAEARARQELNATVASHDRTVLVVLCPCHRNRPPVEYTAVRLTVADHDPSPKPASAGETQS